MDSQEQEMQSAHAVAEKRKQDALQVVISETIDFIAKCGRAIQEIQAAGTAHSVDSKANLHREMDIAYSAMEFCCEMLGWVEPIAAGGRCDLLRGRRQYTLLINSTDLNRPRHDLHMSSLIGHEIPQTSHSLVNP